MIVGISLAVYKSHGSRVARPKNLLVCIMSNSEWSEDQLDGFDIHIVEETPSQFFGLVPDLPNHINPDLFRYAGAEVDDPQVQSILSYLYMIETQSSLLLTEMRTLPCLFILSRNNFGRPSLSISLQVSRVRKIQSRRGDSLSYSIAHGWECVVQG